MRAGPRVWVQAQGLGLKGSGPGARAENGVGGIAGQNEASGLPRSLFHSTNTECQLYARFWMTSQQVSAHLDLNPGVWYTCKYCTPPTPTPYTHQTHMHSFSGEEIVSERDSGLLKSNPEICGYLSSFWLVEETEPLEN